MPGEMLKRLVDAVASSIEGHSDQLDELDKVLGDGDHGANLLRGLRAAQTSTADLEGLGMTEGLRHLAAVLREESGGDGGRLYAAVLDGMADTAPADDPTAEIAISMLAAGVARLKVEGEVEPGMKTMLDVLAPLSERLSTAVERGYRENLDSLAISVCGHALHRTSYMKAARGKAADLGDRSNGHIDPGACSAALVVGAVVGELTRR